MSFVILGLDTMLFTTFLLNQCAMKSKYVVLFVEASDPKVQFDAYRGRWRDSTRAWAWRRWTSSWDGVARGAADGAQGRAQVLRFGYSKFSKGEFFFGRLKYIFIAHN